MIGLMLAAALAVPAAPRDHPGFFPCRAIDVSSFNADVFARCQAGMADLGKQVAQSSASTCLSHDEAACLAGLSRTVVVTTSIYDPINKQADEVGVDGRAIPRIAIFSAASTNSGVGVAGLNLTLTGGKVTSLWIGLPENPLLAHTQAEWDRTGIYDYARAVLGPSCFPEDRLTFYRNVDARLHGSPVASSYQGGVDPTIGHVRTATEMRCGVLVDYSSAHGESASGGAYGGGSIEFRLPS